MCRLVFECASMFYFASCCALYLFHLYGDECVRLFARKYNDDDGRRCARSSIVEVKGTNHPTTTSNDAETACSRIYENVCEILLLGFRIHYHYPVSDHVKFATLTYTNTDYLAGDHNLRSKLIARIAPVIFANCGCRFIWWPANRSANQSATLSVFEIFLVSGIIFGLVCCRVPFIGLFLHIHEIVQNQLRNSSAKHIINVLFASIIRNACRCDCGRNGLRKLEVPIDLNWDRCAEWCCECARELHGSCRLNRRTDNPATRPEPNA